MHTYTIKEVNDFTLLKCMEIFPNIIEHSPKFAKVIFERKPLLCTNDVLLTMYDYLDNLETEEKQALLTHHPDLTAKLEVLEASLTEQSLNEQKAADLKQLPDEEKNTLLDLNSRYRKQFGFPFVICAREYNYKTIINMLEKRLEHSQEEEIINGIGEVKKISTLRILDLITDE